MNTPSSPPGARRTDASVVSIGALAPLTRPGWVETGRHLLAALELAVREVNESGGIVGKRLELIIRDTAADPQRAAAAVDELARVGVVALAGEYHSIVARAAAARANDLGLPFLCSSAVLDALTEQPPKWVARLAPAQSYGWRIYADFPSTRVTVESQWQSSRVPTGCPGPAFCEITSRHAAAASSSSMHTRPRARCYDLRDPCSRW